MWTNGDRGSWLDVIMFFDNCWSCLQEAQASKGWSSIADNNTIPVVKDEMSC